MSEWVSSCLGKTKKETKNVELSNVCACVCVCVCVWMRESVCIFLIKKREGELEFFNEYYSSIFASRVFCKLRTAILLNACVLCWSISLFVALLQRKWNKNNLFRHWLQFLYGTYFHANILNWKIIFFYAINNWFLYANEKNEIYVSMKHKLKSIHKSEWWMNYYQFGK